MALKDPGSPSGALARISLGRMFFLGGLLFVLAWYGTHPAVPDIAKSEKPGGPMTALGKGGVRVAILTPYPPIPHGIGEWIHDQLNKGLKVVCPPSLVEGGKVPCPVEYGVIALEQGVNSYRYPEEVKAVVRRGILEDYFAAADYINANFDVLNLQHEFGMFGGPQIDDTLFPFLDRIKVPISVNFHTVLRGQQIPSAEYQVHVWEVLQRVDHVTNLMPSLCPFHQNMVPSLDCSFIPHGHDPQLHPDAINGQALEGRKVLLSLGYITPDKGFHFVIDALQEVAQRHPDMVYVIAGGHSVGYSGQYLGQLKAQVVAAKLLDHVRFIKGQLLTKAEVLAWFTRADIVLAPHTWQHQISSGTLAMAMGFGKVAIASAFPFAKEFMCNRSDIEGALKEEEPDWNGDVSKYFANPRPCWTIPFDGEGRPDSRALALTINSLLDSPSLREGTSRMALQRMKGSSWPDLAHRYIQLYSFLAQLPRRGPETGQPGFSHAWLRRQLPEPWTQDTLQGYLARAAQTILETKPDALLRPVVLAAGRPRRVFHWVTLDDLREQRWVASEGLGLREVSQMVMEGFQRGPLLFRRWLARPPARLPGPSIPAELSKEGFFYLNNGLVSLRGDLHRGVVTYAVLEPGEVLGHGVEIFVKAVYTVGSIWLDADLSNAGAKVTWGTGDGTVWRQVPMLGPDSREIGTLRGTFRLIPGMSRLECSYRVELNPRVKVPWVEIAINSHYRHAVPEHAVFKGYLGTEEVIAFETLQDVPGTFYELGKNDVTLDWDVALNRMGEHALFTFPRNGSYLKYITQGPRGDEVKSFQHLYHRYVIPVTHPGATFTIQENKALVSQVSYNNLPNYYSVLMASERSNVTGFDVAHPSNPGPLFRHLGTFARDLPPDDPLAVALQRRMNDFQEANQCKEPM